MPLTTEPLVWRVDASDQWTYEFKADEADLHELRKRIQLYERPPSAEAPPSSSVSTWEYYKKVVNPYELVYTQKKYDDFPESVCIYHPLSRSYFKILEVLAITDFFKDCKPSQRLYSAHVCEGPGGFIQGFLEECSRRRLTVGASTAITLKPKQQNVPGWKRATHFLQKNKQVRVVYGEDGTGDLLSCANQADFIRSTPCKVHFFTADGGFDFSTDYDSQEKTIFPLLLASVRTGFEVLAPGGLFVLKFFDLYYDGTRDLICFLSKHFRRWTLYKPATSRPCNPELYFIGDRFVPPTPAVLALLRGWCEGASPGRLLVETPLSASPGRLLVETPLSASPGRLLVETPLSASPGRLLTETPPALSATLDSFVRDSVRLQTDYLRQVFDLIEGTKPPDLKTLLKQHEITSYDWCRAFNVHVYPQRSRSIEASRKCLQETGQLR